MYTETKELLYVFWKLENSDYFHNTFIMTLRVSFISQFVQDASTLYKIGLTD